MSSAFAAPPREFNTRSVEHAYEQAKLAYIEISRKDPRVENLLAWEQAASNLLEFITNNPHQDYGARALFLLARLYETTYRERQFRTGLTRAVYFYEVLAKEHRGHKLADDGLLRLGDLRRYHLKDEAAAKAAYYEIIDLYPQGDMIKAAEQRLGLPGGSAGGSDAGRGGIISRKSDKDEHGGIGGLLGLLGDSSAVPDQGRAIVSKQNSSSGPVIVIDPGHGGSEEGAYGVDGIMEKDVVLAISLMLDELLRERLRARTVLTRTEDVHVPLAERNKIANGAKADLFISVHTNATNYHTARGIETYYLDNTNDKSSLKLAERENDAARREGLGDLEFILSDLIQSAKQPDSISLAHCVQRALVRTLSRYYRDIKDLGVKRAPFYVLVGAHMPCILAEVSFIDHPIEGKRLATKRYQRLVAVALYEGIRDFFERKNEGGVGSDSRR